MASTTQGTQTMNTPHPYEGGPGRSASGVNVNPSSEASTHGVVVGAASRTSIANGQNSSTQSQSPAPSQGQTRSQSGGLASKTQSENQSHSQSGIVGGRKDTGGVAEPAEEEGGAARGTGTGAAEGIPEPEGGYPEQLHAGKLDGYGPEYGKYTRVTLGDRLQGVKEEIKGTVKRDPELKKIGKQRMTGELKRKQLNEEQSADQNQNEGGDDKKDEEKDDAESDVKKTRTVKTDEPGLTEHPQAHPTEKGRQEQAASVQPEAAV